MTDSLIGIAFYVFAAGLIVSALAVVFMPRIVHSALSLVFAFLCIAGLYVLLNAEFVAVVQVIVYVGAVTVLFLFTIMLTQRSYARGSNPRSSQWAFAAFIALGILALLFVGLAGTTWAAGGQVPDNTIERIGVLLLGQYLIPFETVAMLLLVAMIGAIVIAREE